MKWTLEDLARLFQVTWQMDRLLREEARLVVP